MLATTDSALVPVVVPANDGSTIANVAGSPLLQQPFVVGQPNHRQKVRGVEQVAFREHRAERAGLAWAIGWALGFYSH